ncbi:NAD(+) diphosphatase [Tropicimonas sp.]|uniref:NAD(+) diphosphatase n=1 Tax=Tropicimonas sp. TaxID=2067044 RepID=UPI003A86E9EE
MHFSETVTFGSSGLDRAAAIRSDAAALARLEARADARFLAMWRLKPLLRGDEELSLVPLARGSAVLEYAAEPPVFLGFHDGAPWFAVDVSSWEPERQDAAAAESFLDTSEQHFPCLPADHRFAELRSVMARLAPGDGERAVTARGLLAWHAGHGFCARCGAPSVPAQGGWQRRCDACGAAHFPRTDPVVIMLVTHGNAVLMGRSPGWPEGMYSLLAGFVEPGETVEAAVRREVFEEAGVPVGEVGYVASQPWPFPASLMIGCSGRALDRRIGIDPTEIEEALWVSREEMLEVFAGKHPRMRGARRGALAHFILERWLAGRI